nr:hypothetical protein [uncultured Brevundimonas sp.]
MGRTLKTVGMVIGAAALIATGAGALLMPGLAGSVTLFGVSAGTLNMVSAGLTAVGGLLEKPQSAGSGSPSDWTSNPDQPTPFAFGRVGCAGKIIHRDEFGPDNFRQVIVSVYSGAGPVRSFQSYKAGDLTVSFTGAGAAIGKYAGQMWRATRSGSQPDTALALSLPGGAGQQVPGWGSNHKLSGKACDMLVLQQDSKFSVYPSGEPTPLAVIEGVYGYDPRFDDTYPGGAGTCRLGIRATYRWIDNPIIAALNWALGLVENGQVVGGVGASIDGIDVPAFVEAANIADANDWKVTAWPDTSEDVSQVLKQFLQAGGASYARHAGKISCVSRGAARASIVTITGRDTNGPLELDTGSSSFNRLNTITPEFMSEAHGWKKVPADPVTFASLRTEDGGKKSDSIEYRFVPAVKQAAQLAAYDILDAREPFSGTIPLKPHLRRLKRGDCFVIDEPGFLLDGVKCMVLSRTYQPQSGEVRIAFRSETDGKHDLALGKTTTMPDYPSLTPADPTLVSPPLPGDWTITPRPPAPGGGQLPGFDLGGVVSNETATAIIVEHGTSATGPWTQAYQGPPTVTNIPIDGLQPGVPYFVAVQYQRGGNFSERYVYGPYTAPDLIAVDVSPAAPTITALNAELAALEALQASETVIREQQNNAITASLVEAPNLLTNSDGAAGLNGWTPVSGVWTVASHPAYGSAFRCASAGSHLLRSKFYDCEPGQLFNLSLNGDGGSNPDGDQVAYIEFWSRNDGAPAALLGTSAQVGANDRNWLTRRKGGPFPAPGSGASGTYFWRVVLRKTASTDAAAFSRIMVNAGPSPVSWADQATARDLSASVSQQQLAIVDLETGAALAKFELVAAASGGKPARFRMVSSTLGSAIALDAPYIYWGDNTVFEDATDTLQTTTGSVRYITAMGAPFGPDNLTYWVGPSTVATAAASKASAESVNGQWRDNTGDSFFGGKTNSGPFDSGAPSATSISLPKNTWTTIAAVPSKFLLNEGDWVVRQWFDYQINGAPGGADDWSTGIRIAITNQDGSGLQVIHSNTLNVGTEGAWLTFTPIQQWLEGHVSTTRGNKKILLQMNPQGPNVTTAFARNGRFKGLYGA